MRDSNLGLPDSEAPSPADPVPSILRVGDVGSGWTSGWEAPYCPPAPTEASQLPDVSSPPFPGNVGLIVLTYNQWFG